MIYPWVQDPAGGNWFSFCRTLVRLENVGDEILVHVHVVVHGNWCKSRVTQNPADFSDLGSLIRQPFFHLACNLFCVVHFHFLVSHAPIISDRRRLVKPNQGFSLLPMYIIGIFYPPPPPFLPPFLRFCQSSHKSLADKGLHRRGPGPVAVSRCHIASCDYFRTPRQWDGLGGTLLLCLGLSSRLCTRSS